ncbi:MAG TPA: glutathione S-transferase [Nannocystaceae bacterium]|nr:glutathione S-transferase [Nannocystaceae bacterium]
MMRLVVGNKNYSSWSMRPWVAMRAAGIEFEEVVLKFDSREWEEQAPALLPSRRVPTLWIDQHVVWDSLAILETIAERAPSLWPGDPVARMRARALSAEMHSGFAELRKHMPMNIRARHPGKGRTPGALRDIERIVSAWSECLAAGGPFLFGAFGNVDAMFAPVALRFVTYDVELPELAARYVAALREHPAVAAWVADALAETEVVADEEIYA